VHQVRRRRVVGRECDIVQLVRIWHLLGHRGGVVHGLRGREVLLAWRTELRLMRRRNVLKRWCPQLHQVRWWHILQCGFGSVLRLLRRKVLIQRCLCVCRVWRGHVLSCWQRDVHVVLERNVCIRESVHVLRDLSERNLLENRRFGLQYLSGRQSL